MITYQLEHRPGNQSALIQLLFLSQWLYINLHVSFPFCTSYSQLSNNSLSLFFFFLASVGYHKTYEVSRFYSVSCDKSILGCQFCTGVGYILLENPTVILLLYYITKQSQLTVLQNIVLVEFYFILCVCFITSIAGLCRTK